MKANTPIPDLIAQKRDGHCLSADDIEAFVAGVTNGSISPEQIGAFLMAVFLRGMNASETTTLTRAMLHSGRVLSWPSDYVVVDKHSTGGVGDKVSLPLAPALAACGVKVPMISGRGLGHTGGTLDKLEAIPGFSVSVTLEKMNDIIEKVGCCIVGQTSDLVPADRKLYAIRDVTATVASVPLITGSIISKKAAEGLNALVMDVKVGEAAFMTSLSAARELAQSLKDASEGLGIPTVALLTEMNNPIGKTIGNALEVAESVECLKGDGPADLLELVVESGGNLLKLVGRAASTEDGRNMIRQSISSGTALKKWEEMLVAQGVSESDAALLSSDPWSILTRAPHTTDRPTAKDGYVSRIRALPLAKVASRLGAGRERAGAAIDHAVGIVVNAKVGDRLHAGSIWCSIHHREGSVSSELLAEVDGCLELSDEPVAVSSRILEAL